MIYLAVCLNLVLILFLFKALSIVKVGCEKNFDGIREAFGMLGVELEGGEKE